MHPNMLSSLQGLPKRGKQCLEIHLEADQNSQTAPPPPQISGTQAEEDEAAGTWVAVYAMKRHSSHYALVFLLSMIRPSQVRTRVGSLMGVTS